MYAEKAGALSVIGQTVKCIQHLPIQPIIIGREVGLKLVQHLIKVIQRGFHKGVVVREEGVLVIADEALHAGER